MLLKWDYIQCEESSSMNLACFPTEVCPGDVAA